MTTLAFDRGEPRHSLARLLGRSDLAQVVPSLDPKVLHHLVRSCGLEECGEVLALATSEQLTQIFDEDLWDGAPGAADQFDIDRFALWLEVLAEAGDGVAARKLAAMDFDFVTAALSLQFLVLDQEILLLERADSEFEFGGYDPVEGALERRGVTDRESLELGGYTIIAKRRDSWDAILSILTSLNHGHPVFFGRIMQRCCQISTEWIVDNGGLIEVLTSDQQVMDDIAGAREERRRQQGYVSPSDAAAFLKQARQRRDAPWDVNAGGSAEPSTLLSPAVPPGGEDRFSRVRALLLFVRDHDPAAYARRNEELSYLANVLMAGCSFQSRRFQPSEAASAVLAVCNLALEKSHAPDYLVRQSLTPVFEVGWCELYESVCMFAARRLIDALGELRSSDREIQNQITSLILSMRKQVAAGTPWLERENLDVIAILDTPAWAVLVNLIDECPVLHDRACAPVEQPRLRVPTRVEFISQNRQIVWARNFARSLAEKLC